MLPNISVVRGGKKRLFLLVVVKVLFKDFPAKYIGKKLIYEHNNKKNLNHCNMYLFSLKMLAFYQKVQFESSSNSGFIV